ncbi:MAG: 2-succinyl-5-enolpyruvyl-6-hydroxy-3-cyclohexene-1-carboxylic-acid synthase [Ktedonobacteraceae bacterium]
MAHVSEISSLLHNAENPTYAYICAFVDELQRAGVSDIIICPGSRSTPLALAFAAQPGIHTWMHIDERSAAFFALGMAKRSSQPVALLCTSGTAAANFFPAIVEAKLTHVPLLVLTSDRPHELRENGAPQSIDQTHLYGSHVKWFVDVALPEATNAALRYIRTTADRAAAYTVAIPAGPVHLNFPLREPLTPAPIADQPLLPVTQRNPLAWLGRAHRQPYVTVHDTGQRKPDSATVAHLVDLTNNATRGLIIVGPQEDPSLREPLVQMAQHLGYPILADPLSQLRSEMHASSSILTSYDAFLRIDTFVEMMQPELVLRFGAMPTSKPVLTYLKRYSSCPLIVINGNEDWQEPTQLATELIHADSVAFCKALIETDVSRPSRQDRSGEGITHQTRTDWLSTWQDADLHTRQALEATMQDFTAPFEGRVFTELTHLLPENAMLYIGNSMPVRDLDTFFWGSEHALRIMGNRGASGIDGIISSALGASAVARGPNVLVLGDLSFFHDMNGLLAAKLHSLDLTIIVINNDGGGIFSFLPQADYPEHFEQLFGTPISIDFRHAAALYDAQFQRVSDWEQFRVAVKHGMQQGGLHIVEVTTERESNVRMHHQLWQSIAHTLTPILGK